MTQLLEIIAFYKPTSNAQLLEINRFKAEPTKIKQQHEITRSELLERRVERDTLNKDLSKAKGKLEVIRDQIKVMKKERIIGIGLK